jgi:hypothetical protein
MTSILSMFSSCEAKKTQPPGELRARTYIQRWNGSSWYTCRDTGYTYSNVNAYSWMEGYNMGSTPDCGSGYYRGFGYGHLWESSVWRGGYRISPSIWMSVQ